MTIDTRDSTVVRLRPRPNLEVNRHFMCDVGRADYRWMNRGDRIEAPLERDGARLRACDWDTALAQLDTLVRAAGGAIVVLASGRSSCESIGWTLRLAGEGRRGAAMKVRLGDEAPIGSIPNLALRRERAANLEGARMLGMTSSWEQAVASIDGSVLTILLDVELDESDVEAVNRSASVVHFATLPEPRLQHVQLVLPVSAMTEEQGVFINRDRRAQRFLPARSAPGMARPAWWVAAQAWSRGGPDRPVPGTAAEAFGQLTPFAGLGYRDLGLTGRLVGGAVAGAPA